tara:strand:- start:52 stop:537 length:486 start_codon:yes stop_codon:yes gene_type:complete
MIDNISQATLDVIEAMKTKQTIKFNYGGHDVIRKVTPTGFFGDFDGFEGTDEDTESREFKRFRFDKVNEWLGIKDIRHELECALIESRNITKEAKYLCYPIGEITTKLSSLADEHGLLDEMNELLDQVTAAEHNLESAFYECESVFEEAISDEELKSYVDQ